MNIERLRELFAAFLKESGISAGIAYESSSTIGIDPLLKYERIDRYRVLFLSWKELKSLLEFCARHEISQWFGADKLCFGFNYRENMRLSAYCSVQPVEIVNHDEPGAGCSPVPLPPLR